MVKWLLYLVVLIVAFALVVSAAMLIGHVQPLPKRVALLHLGEACELPCWLGITPGKTRLGEARQIIAKAYTLSKADLLQDAVGIITVDGQELGIAINEIGCCAFGTKSSDVVRSIELWVYPISAGDALAAIGSPVGIDLGYGTLTFSVRNQWAEINISSGASSPVLSRYIYLSQPVSYIRLFAPRTPHYDLPWHGFGLYRLYIPSQ